MDNLKLSIFFNSDRVYLLVTNPTESGIEIVYINSTENTIDLENVNMETSKMAIKELHAIFSSFEFQISGISVTFSADSVLVSHLPGKANMTDDEIKQLISLEIRQAYPMFSFEDFTSSIIPTEPDKTGKSSFISIIIQKEVLKTCEEILAPLNAPIIKYELSQFNAQQSFIYNYPEYQGLNIAFLGVQNQFVDISLVNGDDIFYYNLITLNNPEQFGEACAKEIETLKALTNQSVDLALFFGAGLTKNMLNNAKSSLKNVVMEVDKLTAFRMTKTSLPNRQREYCSRTSHIYAPCIGGIMPYLKKKINLFL